MKLGDKILELRKKKGLSQEQLGEKIDVTRQTISNWELGETSPNPDQLKCLSKELNISIDELLDNDVQQVLVEKVSNTEKLAGLILRIIKIFLAVIIIVFILLIVVSILVRVNRTHEESRLREESIYCTLYGEEHSYTIRYVELTGRPIAEGGDSYFNDILDLDKYNDAHQIFNVINDYVKKNGGTCTMIDERDLSDLVEIEIQNLTDTGMHIVIHDSSPNKIVYGDYFWIDKYENGVWEGMEAKQVAFNDIAYYADENGILELDVNWEHIYGKLPKGIYRIVKNVSFESDSHLEEHRKYYIWQEFEIE